MNHELTTLLHDLPPALPDVPDRMTAVRRRVQRRRRNRATLSAVAVAAIGGVVAAVVNQPFKGDDRVAAPAVTAPSSRWTPGPTLVRGRVVTHVYPSQLPRGRTVAASEVFAKSALIGSTAFGLALSGTGTQNGTYPVVSHDDSRTWSVNGPKLHIDAAQGATAITHVSAASAEEAYLWGDWLLVTSDGGRRWLGARLGQMISSVHQVGPAALQAVAISGQVTKPGSSEFVTWRYESSDDGRSWRYLGYGQPSR